MKQSKKIITALLSEFGIDQLIHQRLHSRKLNPPKFRPYVFLPKSKKYGFLLNWTIFAASLVWILSGPLFFFYKTLLHIASFKKHPASDCLPSSENLFLLLSPRGNQLSENKGLEARFNYFTVPWVKHNKAPNTTLPLYSLLRIWDFINCYFQASHLALSFIFLHNRSLIGSLQTYVLYEVCLVTKALEKLPTPKKIAWVNHYDRWAVLFNLFWEEDKLPPEKSLIQHGIEEPDFDPPIKLNHVKKLYHFGDLAKNWFSTFLTINKECQFIPLSAELNLIPVDLESYQNSILILGQPDVPEKEIQIIQLLLKNSPESKILLKPHPLYPLSIYPGIESLPIEIISDKGHFPRVDIGINFYSTLGVEYESCGIPIVWHYETDVETAVKETLAILDSLERRATPENSPKS